MRELLGKWAAVEVGGNSMLSWVVAAAILLGIALVGRVVQAFFVRRLERGALRTENRLDDLLVKVVRATSPFFHLAIGLMLASNALELAPHVRSLIRMVCAALIGLQCGRWAQAAVAESIDLWAARREGGQSATMAAGLRFLGRLVIWTVVVLAILSNLGVELSAVIAGLGVGGVAAALAIQSTLGDLIAGVSMYFDRPFDIGDFITVDGYLGTVLSIGARTTRLASVDGEEIVFPNGDLVKSRIRNYARMRERRVVFGFGIEYNLPAAKLERARELTIEIIKAREGLRFDRAHFKEYGEYSLAFEVVYYVLSPDYNAYMDHHHAINMALYQSFEAEGIRFALPVRTVFMQGQDRREPSC